MLVFILLFIYQQVDALLEYIYEEDAIQLEYSDNWKFNKDTKNEINPENAKLLNKKVGELVYPDFNYFNLFQVVPYTENDGYESISDGSNILFFSNPLS